MHWVCVESWRVTSHSFAKSATNEETVSVPSGKYVFELRDVNPMVVATFVLKIEDVICYYEFFEAQ